MNKLKLSDSAVRYLLTILDIERVKLLEMYYYSLRHVAIFDSINEVESAIPSRFFADALSEDE